MVAFARSQLADPREVAVYHVWNRVVRRAWLCGQDPLTEKDYSYRRRWIVEREQLLAQLFAIDIAFHAEMSNHLHLVLRTRPDLVDTWSDEEVIRRWLTITKLTRNFADQLEVPDPARVRMKASDPKYVAQVRLRLSNISDFMAALQEYIARRANTEEGVSGRFWETRFGSRRCTDEASVLVCGIYVDLNQIRACEAETPEQSTHTSAHDRIVARAQRQAAEKATDSTTQQPPLRDSWLCPLELEQGPNAEVRPGVGSTTPWRASDKGILPMSCDEYLDLLDWTGRQLQAGKAGTIPSHLQPILERLHVRPKRWIELVESLDHSFRRALGRLESLLRAAVAAGQRWLHGVTLAAALFA